MRTLITLALIVISLAPIGCASQRALPVVRADGDRAFDYGRYEVAKADYQEVVDRAPNDWEYRLRLANTLMVLDLPKQAQEQFAVLQGMRPQDDAIVERFAQSMYESGDMDRLISFLQRRAEDTQAVNDYLRLGWYAIETGDADLAQRALLTAARLDGGTTVEPQLALADFYLAAGDRAAAMRRLRMALGIDQDNEDVKRKIRAMGEIPGPSFALTPEEG